jgi:hypothetical protein
MNSSLQLRVLYRQFLFRLMDVELLSTSAHGSSSGLFGQLGATLISISVVLSWCAFVTGMAIGHRPSAPLLWSVERFMVSLTMLVVGVFALLSWDSVFPDRRDVLVLAPLPVRARTLFAAKIAAAASALVLTVAALNCLAAFAWPMMVGPPGSGFLATMRFAGAFWVALLAAGTFLYGAVLGVQAVAAQLPRRWYLRASSVLQAAAFILFLGVFCLAPSLDSAKALGAPENQRILAWLPPYWFMGLLSELSGAYPAEGHAAMAPLAYRALLSLPIALLVAGAAFLFSYLRTLRKILEEPDLAPGSRGGIWLPRFGNLPQTALAHFVIRTLLRSRRHRVILMFYLGGGFALVIVYLGLIMKVMRLTGIDLLHRVNGPTLVVNMLMLGASVLGTRAVFSLPLDLGANWLFRVTPAPGAAASLSAIRRALLALSVLPVTSISAALLLCFWPWTLVLEHVLVVGLLGSLLADAFLKDFRKIPFTCSYLPGKKVNLIFWVGVVPLVVTMDRLVELERRALASPALYVAVAAILGAAALAARRVANKNAAWNGPEVQFEESPDELIVLGLNG